MGVLQGAGTGAAIGSVIPGIGTAAVTIDRRNHRARANYRRLDFRREQREKTKRA